MENKFYTIQFPRTHKYQIEGALGEIFDQDRADFAFIQTLKILTIASRGSKKEIEFFLTYQLEQSKANKNSFLNHTEKTFKGKELELQPYAKSAGHVHDWIKNTRSKPNPKNTNATTKKPDPSFEEIVRKKEKVNEVIQKLKQKGIIENNVWTADYTQLVALYNILLINGLIKPLKYAPLGRIFSKQFNVKMYPRSFSETPKNQHMEWIAKETGLSLNQ